MRIKTSLVAVAAGTLATAGMIPVAGPPPALAAPAYEALPQTGMSIVDVDSVETVGEGSNGPAELILDGKKDTYWHTQWNPTKDPLPHHVTVKLGEKPAEISRVSLTPRQSSNGSGRAAEYSIETSTDATCAGGFGEVATGTVAAAADITQDVVIDFPATTAQCVKVVYKASWGGNNRPEQVATMAEFNAYTATGEPEPGPTPSDPAPAPEIPIPDNALEITDGTLTVRTHPAFPQIVDYRLGDQQLIGQLGAPLTSITIDEQAYPVTVGTPQATASEVTYPVTIADIGAELTVVVGINDGVVTWSIPTVKDPNGKVHRISVPGLNLVTVPAADGGHIMTATLGADRNASADTSWDIAAASEGQTTGYMIAANTHALAAGFMANSVSDNTSKGPRKGSNARWIGAVATVDGAKVGTVSPGPWVHRGTTADLGLGPDEMPMAQVKVVADRNGDGAVNWQDSAIATREMRPATNGQDEVKNKVITRIPFNIVSQATHPFLRTLEDTKRIGLETDGLGQQVLLKGYQAEGHDAAHPDYGGHYNTRAGGLEDLKTLADEAAKWNANIGVHVNVTESYSEAYAFSEELLRMPPQKAWGWMNQAYYIDGPKDLGTTNVLKRFQQFRDEAPENLNWLYIDVYYPDGWEGQRLGKELQKQGWVLSSEWSDKFPDYSVWSHWANDENYGGQNYKGLNSQLVRFVENSYRDTFNPHPILGNANVKEFEGWAGNINHKLFIDTIWQRNLPVKFLQQSNIMTWGADTITFENGTVATSPEASVSGTVVPTNRTFTYDGATVYEQGRYLLPWTDGGDRLYHYNPAGGASTWTLTDSWKNQGSLKLFKLTDTGRVDMGDIAVSGGKVTINAEANTAYVLYPSGKVTPAKAPNWGQGTHIADPGFFSGTLDAYTVAGDVTVEKTTLENYQAVLGAGESSLAQTLTLPAGDYSAWAWVEIEPGQSRPVTVTASGGGVSAAGYQEVVDSVPTTSFSASTAMNATASDEKLRTYFQRARVTFHTDGSPVTFTVAAGEGSAKVRIDDLRVVPFVAGKDAKPTEQTIFFDDFENVDTGYWPFVTGLGNQGGDARTQLAERHEPYSQKGWYGVIGDKVVEGGKLNDNVLDGTWSLMMHEENGGLIMRTIPASINFKAGHKYRVSMDHQSAYADKYRLVIGYDRLHNGQIVSQNVTTQNVGEVRNTQVLAQEFVASGCGDYWVGFEKIGGGAQADLVIDNFRVEDLGPTDEVTACAAAAIDAPAAVAWDTPFDVTTTAEFFEAGAVTGVVHALTVPDGWKVDKVDSPDNSDTRQAWKVTAPKSAEPGELKVTVTYQVDGEDRAVLAVATVQVLRGIINGTNHLSDLPFYGEPSNGWGPVERDQSNGEQDSGDGQAISVGGQLYEKGLGAHAPSSVSFRLNGQCQRLKGVVGVQDGRSGSVTFEVQGDGETIFGRTGVMKAGQTAEMNVDITGINIITLLVGDGGDGVSSDHANWADARVECEVPEETESPSPEPTVDPTETPSPTVPAPVEPTDPVDPTVVPTDGPTDPGTPPAPGQPSDPGKPTDPGRPGIPITGGELTGMAMLAGLLLGAGALIARRKRAQS